MVLWCQHPICWNPLVSQCLRSVNHLFSQLVRSWFSWILEVEMNSFWKYTLVSKLEVVIPHLLVSSSILCTWRPCYWQWIRTHKNISFQTPPYMWTAQSRVLFATSTTLLHPSIFPKSTHPKQALSADGVLQGPVCWLLRNMLLNTSAFSSESMHAGVLVWVSHLKNGKVVSLEGNQNRLNTCR